MAFLARSGALRAVARTAVAARFASTSARNTTAGPRAWLFGAASAAAVGAVGVALATQHNTVECAPKVPRWGAPGTNNERTFIAIKPDGVQRGLIGDVIQRFEKRGYKLVGLKMVWPSKADAEKHYADLSKKPFFKGLTSFFSSGPIVCMCWEGKDVIRQGRAMLGETNPLASKPGSIRGDYSIDLGRNIIHGSDGPESAQAELSMWFTDAEIHSYDRVDATWVYE